MLQCEFDILKFHPGFCLIVNKDFSVNFVNEFTLNFLGKKAEDIEDKRITEIFSQKKSPHDRTDLNFILELDENNSKIIEHTALNNQTIFIKWNMNRFVDNKGNELFFLAGQDVTDLKNEIAEVRLSEKYFNTLFNNVIDAVYVYKLIDRDKPGYFINVNKIACDTLGYTKEELLKKSILNIDALESLGDLLYVHRVLDEQQKVVFETIQKTKNGKKFPVEVSAHMVKINDEKLVYAIARDITEQKKEREELRQFAYFAKHNPSPVIRFDKTGTIILFNEAAKKTFLKDITPGKSKISDVFSTMKELNAKEFIENGEVLIEELMINERYFNFTIIGVPRLAAGQIFTSDITRIKELSKLKEDFIAIVSHDIRSPFNGILGFAEILLNDPSLSRENHDMIKMIEESARIQLNYINDLLDIITLGEKQLDINLAHVEMEKIIQTSINTLKVLADKKDIELTSEVDKGLSAYIDYPKITQVLNNLISNALKFSNQGGSVKVKCFLNSDKKIETHIIDHGIGIKKENQEHIFNRYSKTSTRGTKGEKGTGLGLSICKLLINAHNGQIYVNSEWGKGSDFYFIIPCSNALE